MGLPIGKVVRLEGTYDFDVDGGATGTYELISVPANFAVRDVYLEIETAVVSGGTPTLEIGDGDDPNGYIADFEASSGSAGFINLNQDDKGVYLWDDTNDAADVKTYASADTIDLEIGAAALTAGKIRVVAEGERLG